MRLTLQQKRIADAINNHTKKCEFRGEFPSVTLTDRSEGLSGGGCILKSYPYRCFELREELSSQRSCNKISIERASRSLLNSKELLKNIRHLYHKKASEVVVFTASDTDRSWKREIGHGIPIGFFFKGYSLSTYVMRNIAEKVLKECVANGLHVPCTTFDGQWFKLLEEDEEGKPHTLFQLQRNHWKEVTKHTATELLDFLCENANRSSCPEELTISANSLSLKVTDIFIQDVISILKSSTRKRNPFDQDTLKAESVANIFSNSTKLNALTIHELKEVSKNLNATANAGISLKGNKSEIVKEICLFLDMEYSESDQMHSPPTLYLLTKNKMKTLGNSYLEIIYAKKTWPEKENEWRNTSSVISKLQVCGVDDSYEFISPVYIPEKKTIGDKSFLHVRCIDGHHLRSNLRSKICKGGTKNIKKDAWISVAKTGLTSLSYALLEQNKDGKLLDQQNSQYIKIMFSQEVEEQMRKKGYENEADFTRMIRNWHDAEDAPGIPSAQRCLYALQLREWMLKNFDLSSFPPPGGYIKGFPRVTFEALVCNIEAHLYLYPLSKSGTYNWRSLSTLVAESVFGEVAEMEIHNNGVPSGKSFKRDFSAMAGLNAMRLKPDRPFCMQTAKSRIYPVPEIDADAEDFDEDDFHKEHIYFQCKDISRIVPRDHQYDRRQRKEEKQIYKAIKRSFFTSKRSSASAIPL